MNAALSFPGLPNGWTMPVKGRIDMLTTGIRTPVGLKISGADVGVIEDIGSQLESILPPRSKGPVAFSRNAPAAAIFSTLFGIAKNWDFAA